MVIETPAALLLLLILPWLICRRGRTSPPALRFSFTGELARLRPSLRARCSELPFWLRLAALLLLIVASSGPRLYGRRVRDPGHGLAVQILVDRSYSMGSDFDDGSRFDAARRMFLDFVKERGSDLMGVIAFSSRARTVCPLTLDHAAVRRALTAIEPVGEGDRGTAIGDALALAAARLQLAAPDKRAGRIGVLFTDGESNGGVRSLAQAAALAEKWGVRVHVVRIADEFWEVDANFQLPEDALAALAQRTGGLCRSVRDMSAVRAIGQEIDRLEDTQNATYRFEGGRHLAHFLIAAGLALLACEMLLSATWLRSLP